MIGRISLISHKSGSLLGVIELTVLCAFISRVSFLNGQIRGDSIVQVKEGGGVDSLTSLGKRH